MIWEKLKTDIKNVLKPTKAIVWKNILNHEKTSSQDSRQYRKAEEYIGWNGGLKTIHGIILERYFFQSITFLFLNWRLTMVVFCFVKLSNRNNTFFSSFFFQLRHIRNKNKIHVHGQDVANPVTSFDQLKEEFNLHPRILENIQKSNYTSPTPIQMQAIPVMMQVYLLMCSLINHF